MAAAQIYNMLCEYVDKIDKYIRLCCLDTSNVYIHKKSILCDYYNTQVQTSAYQNVEFNKKISQNGLVFRK